MAKAIVLDTETTGLDPATDRLVELAAIGLNDDTTYSTLTNPGRDIPPEAMAIHHITEEMVQGQPDPAGAVARMLTIFDFPEIIIAHNARFDKGMMEALLPPGYSPTWICTYRSALGQWPEAPKHNNQTLRYWLGLKPSLPEGLAPHRALYDIIVTREIYRTLRTFQDVSQLMEWTENPMLLRNVRFGKHTGKTWDQVDYGYLRWCCAQADMDPDVKFTAQHWMEHRNGR